MTPSNPQKEIDDLSKQYREHEVYTTDTMFLHVFWHPFDLSLQAAKVMFYAAEGHLLDMDAVEGAMKDLEQWLKTEFNLDHANLVVLDSGGNKTQLGDLGGKGRGRNYG